MAVNDAHWSKKELERPDIALLHHPSFTQDSMTLRLRDAAQQMETTVAKESAQSAEIDTIFTATPKNREIKKKKKKKFSFFM